MSYVPLQLNDSSALYITSVDLCNFKACKLSDFGNEDLIKQRLARRKDALERLQRGMLPPSFDDLFDIEGIVASRALWQQNRTAFDPPATPNSPTMQDPRAIQDRPATQDLPTIPHPTASQTRPTTRDPPITQDLPSAQAPPATQDTPSIQGLPQSGWSESTATGDGTPQSIMAAHNTHAPSMAPLSIMLSLSALLLPLALLSMLLLLMLQ